MEDKLWDLGRHSLLTEEFADDGLPRGYSKFLSNSGKLLAAKDNNIKYVSYPLQLKAVYKLFNSPYVSDTK